MQPIGSAQLLVAGDTTVPDYPTRRGALLQWTEIPLAQSERLDEPIAWRVEVLPVAEPTMPDGSANTDDASMFEIIVESVSAQGMPEQRQRLPQNGWVGYLYGPGVAVRARTRAPDESGTYAPKGAHRLYVSVQPVGPGAPVANELSLFAPDGAGNVADVVVPPYSRRVHLRSAGIGTWTWLTQTGHRIVPAAFLGANEVRPVPAFATGLRFTSAVGDLYASAAWERA